MLTMESNFPCRLINGLSKTIRGDNHELYETMKNSFRPTGRFNRGNFIFQVDMLI